MKQTIRLTESELRLLIKETINESVTSSKQYAYYIWNTYAQIQQQIMNNLYDVYAGENDIIVYGHLNGKEWTVQFLLNPYDKHKPDINSENVVPYLGEEEIYTNNIFNEYSDEVCDIIENKYGFKLQQMINLFGGGGDFPEKVIDAIDDYDNQDSDNMFDDDDEDMGPLNEAITRAIRKLLR